ncbi:MAG: HD domain-containing protein [Actinobacteria bacterium]|nr:HD domain-containing protein [Actinomycetota bacterium]
MIKAQPPLRILLIGGDASMWVALSSTLGSRSSQIVVAEGIDPVSLETAARDIDVIVVVTDSDSEDPAAPLRMVRKIGLQRGAVVIADASDKKTAAEALALGIGGYVVRGSDASRLANAITEVADRGMLYSAPAADVLHDTLEATHAFSPSGDMHAMNAARALASALELKDTYTGGHAERVTSMAMRLARAAMLDGAVPSESLEAAFLLHDVGKIGIPETILTKPGGLTDTETLVLRTHPILGERIVAPLGFPSVVRDVIRYHHERWDGRGYPDGLEGDDIPPAARLFAIADAIDAMTSLRPYRRPMNFDAAIQEVLDHAGVQFDPTLCRLVGEVFLERPAQLA